MMPPRFIVGDLIIHRSAKGYDNPIVGLIVRYLPADDNVPGFYEVLSREEKSLWTVKHTDDAWIKIT